MTREVQWSVGGGLFDFYLHEFTTTVSKVVNLYDLSIGVFKYFSDYT